MKKIILIAFVLLCNLPVNAQESVTLSLKQAVDYALKNSYAAINARRDIMAAKKKKYETTTIGLPKIDANIDYQNWLKKQISLIPAEFFGGAQGEFAEVSFGTKHNMNASVTLRQLIFDGSYIVGLQSAKTYFNITKNTQEKTALGIREAVINAYGNVLLSEESVLILEKNLQVLNKILKETNQLFLNGFVEEESVEQLKITQALVNSELSKTKKLKAIAYKMLNLSLGINIDIPLVLTDSLHKLSQENNSLKTLSSKFSIENHIDYKIAKNNERGNSLLVKLEQSKALPTLKSFVNFGYVGYGEQFNFFKKEQQWFHSSLLGVSLEIPIFSSFERSSKTQQAKIELEKATTNLTVTTQKIRLQLETAKTEYTHSIENYTSAKQNLTLAQKIENKQQTKFFEGISSSFELLEAQKQLYAMQQNYLQSMRNLIAKKAALDSALNTPINQ